MNETIKQLHARKSVRAFSSQKISAQEKKEILEAAMQAPSAGNQQMYTILDITDDELKQKLSVSCDNQAFIAKADMVLVFCADFQKWYDAFVEAGLKPRKPSYGDLLLGIQDALIAAQNAVTAAWSLGIGSCYIGDIMEHLEYHTEILDLPPFVFPATVLVLGFPTEQQQNRKKPERCELKHIVHENKYRHMDGQELRQMFDWKTGVQSFDDWMKAFCTRKYESDFSKEMSRSIKQSAFLKQND